MASISLGMLSSNERFLVGFQPSSRRTSAELRELEPMSVMSRYQRDSPRSMLIRSQFGVGSYLSSGPTRPFARSTSWIFLATSIQWW